MCNRDSTISQSLSAAWVRELSRENLEAALERADKLAHTLCSDSQIIVAAARKHLETMPRKVKVIRWLAISDEHPTKVFEHRELAQRYVKQDTAKPSDWRVVEVTGEYMRTD